MFTLLSESGLGSFYEMSPAPGRRVAASEADGRWSFLDDPAIQDRLLDFKDDREARITFHLPAIHCVACVWLLENLFRLHAGIGETRVNFARREVAITFAPARIKLGEVAGLLASLGYEPALSLETLDGGPKHPPAAWRQREWLQVGIAGFAFGNIMLLSLPGYLGLDSASGPWFKTLAGWLGLALALPSLIYSAADYWRAAWTGLRRRALTLEVPIALGLAAIYAQSVYEVAGSRGAGYGDSLTGLIFFLLCGRLFQRKTFERLVFDRDYKAFFPLAVLRQGKTGPEPVSISRVAVGDRLLIRHGELVPADSRLVAGEALVDYAFVTGEARPVKTGAGERLHAGGRQTGGAIEVEVVRPVSESYLTSLWDSAAFRKQRDHDLESLINRYSPRFTMTVLGIALAAGLGWSFVDGGLALKAFTSVLIVACPCALALASPLTLGAAQRRLAARGIFLRNAQVIERLGRVDAVVFDKTGTLTATGAGGLAWTGPPLSVTEQAWIAAAARHSAHPLARQIARSIPAKDYPVAASAFQEFTGQGLEARVEGHALWLGSAAWLAERGALVQAPLARTGSLAAPAGGVVHVAIDGVPRGHFVLASALRGRMEELFRRLRGNYELVLLSGDNDREAGNFRALLGAGASVRFNQSPFDKLAAIQKLQADGRNVMMVGDGLNDAGALQQADAGVAVVEQMGVFSPASDVILDAAQLARLADVLGFSRRMTQLVRAGFVISGLYNVVGIAIAASGRLSPLVCAVLMPLSSVTILLFALGSTWFYSRRLLGGETGRSGADGFIP